jgi:hypothetical protein
MSKNTDEAARINALFEKLPSKMLAAVSVEVYEKVLNLTIQDSGEAAFNWRAGVNNESEIGFTPSAGRAPVGSKGDKRSLTGGAEVVVGFRMQEFLSKISSGNLTDVHIYNPVPSADHAANARLSISRAVATNQDFMDDIAERALNANLPKR